MPPGDTWGAALKVQKSRGRRPPWRCWGMRFEIWIERASGRRRRLFSSDETRDAIRVWNRIINKGPSPKDWFLTLEVEGWSELRANHGGKWTQWFPGFGA